MTDQPTAQPADTGSAAPPPPDVVRLAYDRIADYPAEQLNALAAVLSQHMPFVPLSHRFGVAVLLAEAAAMSPPPPVADVDEALVEEVAQVAADSARDMTIGEVLAESGDDRHLRAARAVLAHLADRLIPADAEEREEWGVHYANAGRFVENVPDKTTVQADEETARATVAFILDETPSWGPGLRRRTVRTWKTPDGSTGTLVGPWVEVEG
jgi:hypothetical protein